MLFPILSLVIDRVIKQRETDALIEKLNLIIGVFFSEVGTSTLKYFTAIDSSVKEIANFLIVDPSWEDRDFKKALEKCFSVFICYSNVK